MIYISNTWKFENILLNDSLVKEAIKIGIADYFEINNSEIIHIKTSGLWLKPFSK